MLKCGGGDFLPKIDWRIVCTGLICLTALEVYALSIGINGTLLKIVLIAIASVIGITIPLDKFIKH